MSAYQLLGVLSVVGTLILTVCLLVAVLCPFFC